MTLIGIPFKVIFIYQRLHDLGITCCNVNQGTYPYFFAIPLGILVHDFNSYFSYCIELPLPNGMNLSEVSGRLSFYFRNW